MTENRRIFINIIATYIRSVYSIVLGLFCGRWALMALGEIDYGLSGLIGGLMVFISFFNGVLASANSRFYAISVGAASVADDRISALEECRYWFNTALSVHLVVPVALIVVGYPLGVCAIEQWLTIPVDRISDCIWVFRFLCISCFVGMVNVPFQAMYNAKQYIAELTVYSFVTSTLNVVMLYYMVTHPDVWLTRYTAWTCMLNIVPQVIIALRAMAIFPECRVKISYMWDRRRLKKLGYFTGWQMVGIFCGMLRTQGMSIVINKFFGVTMNAAQAIGNTVQGHCVSLASSMQGAFTPVITQACGAGDYAKMNRFALRTSKFNVVLAMIFMLPLAAELPLVLQLWLKNPPSHAVGLCYCAMLFYLAEAITSSHCIVVNAVGKLALYQVVINSISIMTVPLAVVLGFLKHNIYWVMFAQIFIAFLVSIVRLFFARAYAGTSIRDWMFGIMARVVVVIIICSFVAYIPHCIMVKSFSRVFVTVILCEIVFLPLVWLVILSAEERRFLREKFALHRLRIKQLGICGLVS